MGETKELLNERKKTHGDFHKASVFVQNIKAEARMTPNWHRMSDSEKEAIDMIIHKLGRWLYGISFEDHPKDICGYAKLAEEKILQENKDGSGDTRSIWSSD